MSTTNNIVNLMLMYETRNKPRTGQNLVYCIVIFVGINTRLLYAINMGDVFFSSQIHPFLFLTILNLYE